MLTARWVCSPCVASSVCCWLLAPRGASRRRRLIRRALTAGAIASRRSASARTSGVRCSATDRSDVGPATTKLSSATITDLCPEELPDGQTPGPQRPRSAWARHDIAAVHRRRDDLPVRGWQRERGRRGAGGRGGGSRVGRSAYPASERGLRGQRGDAAIRDRHAARHGSLPRALGHLPRPRRTSPGAHHHRCGDGGCPGGWDCDGAHCQAPDRPVCYAQQRWNTYLTYAHISGAWYDTDVGIRAGTPVQLRHTSWLDRTGIYGWGYMPEFTDLATGYRFRLLHLRPQHPWATDVGHVCPAGYIVDLSGDDTHDADMLTYSTGQHLCIQTLRSYREAFPSGVDACR